jgi:plastocyanin/mono/diheme cytochrome c family protein
MNTSKQINAMISLLLLLLLLVGIYTIWDPFRAEATAERTHEEIEERAAHTFARNCRSCHGNAGEGRIGPALDPEVRARNPELRNFADPAALDENQHIITDTLRCGRIGTLMPPWALDQGGSLNDEQIRQLMILITNPTEHAWEHVAEISAEEDATVPLPEISEVTAGAVATGSTNYVCGQRAPEEPEDTGPVEVRTDWQIVATDNKFDITRMGAPVNTPVTVRLQNDGAALHNWNVQNVQGANGQPIIIGPPPTFLAAGQSGSITFTITTPGTYNYICDVHPVDMKGTLVVQEASAAPAAGDGTAASPAPSPAPGTGPATATPTATPTSTP